MAEVRNHGGYSTEHYLKELKGELQVVWVHGVDAVLGPPGRLQRVPTFRLRVTWLVATGTDHTGLQGGGNLVPRCRTKLFLLFSLFLYAF